MSNNNSVKINLSLAILAVTSLILSSSVAQAQITEVIEQKSARPAGSDLKFRQAGVPVFDFVQKQGNQAVRVKEIPKLDIGEERQFKIGVKETKIQGKNLNLKEFKKLDSPAFITVDKKLVQYFKAQEPKISQPSAPAAAVPMVKMLEVVPSPIVTEPSDSEVQKLTDIKPDEFKMIQALMFLDYQKKYDLAMALFVELMDNPNYKYQAMYHYAETALGQKLFSEFRAKMITVTKEASDLVLKKMATEQLVKNIEYLEVSDIGLIDPIAEAQGIDTSSNSKYLLKKAKYEMERGNLGEAEIVLQLIPMASPEYSEAVLLKSVFNYRQNKVVDSISDLETIWPTIEKKTKDPIRNLIVLTLARLHFQQGEYQTAFKYYQKVDRSSGQWLQSMVEQAWTQVLAGDNVGAAGNMFSLHTEFFTKAYAPETYVVRSVGYLNLCQYGDGVSVLNSFKEKYSKIQENLMKFQKNNTEDIRYYELVKSWMKDTSRQEIEGVPRAFIVELARHPSYTLTQKQINNYEDENSRFNKITIDLIRKEKLARLAMLKAKNAYTAAKAKYKTKKDLEPYEQNFLAKGVEHVIVARAKDGIKKMREAALVRLDKEKNDLRNKTALNIKKRYSDFTSTLDNLLDQKDVLSYEIFSGAGEHIRYQMAGGDVKPQDQDALQKDKNGYEWKHKGEVWDDEIGHYRSSLKNVCPKEEVGSETALSSPEN